MYNDPYAHACNTTGLGAEISYTLPPSACPLVHFQTPALDAHVPPPFIIAQPYNPLPAPVPMPGTNASRAPSCALISRSCSIICCSSTAHTANGTASMMAPVVSTQRPLPPHQAPVLVAETVEVTVLVRARR